MTPIAKEKVGVILVGAGYVAGTLKMRPNVDPARPSVAINRDMPYEVIAVVETDDAKRAEARRQFPDAQVCENLRDLKLDQARRFPTAVKESASLSCRPTVFKWGQEHDLPVLLEKPLGWSSAMLAPYRNGPGLHCNFTEAFNPAVLEAARIIAERGLRIRRIEFCRVNTVLSERLVGLNARYGVTGGSFIDKTVHDFHLLLEIFFPRDLVSLNRVKAFDIRFAPADLPAVLEGGHPRFLTQNGENCTAEQATASVVADMQMGVTTDFLVNRDHVEIQFVCSWAGMPEFYNPTIPPSLLSKAHLREARSGIFGGKAYSLPNQNLKSLLVEATDPAGNLVSVYCCLQQRGCVEPFVAVVDSSTGRVEMIEQAWEIPSVRSLSAFCEWILGRRPSFLDSSRAVRTHELMIEVRDRCLGEYQFNPGKEWDALRRALFHDRQFVIGGISTRSSEDVPQTSAYIPWREV